MARNFCFTLNNYSEDDKKLFLSLPEPLTYVCFGEEVAGTGTPHLQGYLELDRRCRPSALKKIFGRKPHWEARRGTQKQAIAYCKKDGTFYEAGETKKQGHRTDLERVIDAVKSHTTMCAAMVTEPLVARHPHLYKTVRAELDEIEAPAWRDVEVKVYIGPTGSGKTKLAMDHPSVYKLDMANNLWFNGYNRQTRLVIDDFYGWIRYGHLLQLLDGYKMRLEIKGGFTYAFFTEIIITSNKLVDEWYSSERDLSALYRRISSTRMFE